MTDVKAKLLELSKMCDKLAYEQKEEASVVAILESLVLKKTEEANFLRVPKAKLTETQREAILAIVHEVILRDFEDGLKYLFATEAGAPFSCKDAYANYLYQECVEDSVCDLLTEEQKIWQELGEDAEADAAYKEYMKKQANLADDRDLVEKLRWLCPNAAAIADSNLNSAKLEYDLDYVGASVAYDEVSDEIKSASKRYLEFPKKRYELYSEDDGYTADAEFKEAMIVFGVLATVGSAFVLVFASPIAGPWFGLLLFVFAGLVLYWRYLVHKSLSGASGRPREVVRAKESLESYLRIADVAEGLR